MMKKFIMAMLVLSMVASLVACGGTGNSGTDKNSENKGTESQVGSNDSESEESEEDSKVVYKVTVVDESGNPIAGAMVQMCKDACVPARTNDSGVAEFNLEETDGYKVSVLSLPEGYVYEGEAEIYLESGQTELTVTVKAGA